MGYVYKITNTINNKAYIGISIHEPEKRRIRQHLSGRGNRIIARAVKKYGKEVFTYEILEENVFDEFLPEFLRLHILLISILLYQMGIISPLAVRLLKPSRMKRVVK